MRTRLLLAVILLGTYAIPVQATLIDRGGGMIYDDVLDITWLSDANLGGSMTWDDSVAWADSLIFGDFDDWRLASMDVNMDGTIVDCSSVSAAACQDNELGYMFYQNLGGSLFDNLTGDQAPFTNIQLLQWSGTGFATFPVNAWVFGFDQGVQIVDLKRNLNGAWAVRSGDVLTAPEPGTVALIGLGLAGVGFARRRGRSGLK